MKFYKRVFKHPLFIRFVSFVAASYISFVYKTTRWQRIGWDGVQKYWDQDKSFICSFWHNRLLMGVFGWTHHKPFHMLISSHSDGQLIARTVGHHGIKTIPGSKTKGGLAALRSLLKVLKEGDYVGITPDGPRGPRFEVGEGTVNLARLSGCDIVPFTYSIKRRKVLGSWDRFIIALPFSSGVLAWGEPISVPKKAAGDELEKIRLKVQNQMRDLADKADALCGHEELR